MPKPYGPPTAYLDISSYDNIVVTKGYHTVLNGFGATGGSIVLEKNPPKFTEEFSYKGALNSGFDSNSEMWNIGGHIIAGNKDAYIHANIGRKSANNYEDGRGNEVRSSFEESNAGLTLGFTPDNTHFYVGYDYHEIEDALFPGAGMDSPISESQTFRTGFEKDIMSGAFRKIDVSAYYSAVDHIMDNYSLRPAGMMLRRVLSESNTYGAKIKADFKAGNQLVNASLEYRRNERDATRLQGMNANNVNSSQSIMWPDIATDEIGFAAETTFDIDDNQRLTVGGRYDFVYADFGRKNENAAIGGQSANDLYNNFYGYDADSRKEHNLGGLLRYENDITTDTTFYTAISRAVRTADATERGLANNMIMMGQNRSWVGNPRIKPEKHHQIDIGITKKNSQWNFTTNLYANYVQDYILRDSARGQDGILLTATQADIYRNINALLSGLEFNGGWNITPDFYIYADATYTYGQNRDDNIALAQIPPLQGKISADWQAFDSYSFGSTMRWSAQQPRVDTNPTIGTGRDIGQTGGFAVLDAHTTITAFEPAAFTIGISNIFDKNYASHLNRSNISDPTEIRVNEAGRSFYIKAHVPF